MKSRTYEEASLFLSFAPSFVEEICDLFHSELSLTGCTHSKVKRKKELHVT